MLTLAAAATSRIVGRDRFRPAGDEISVNVVQHPTSWRQMAAFRSHLAISSTPCYI
jgi:hypothetical protein